jgi:hypothetical protein
MRIESYDPNIPITPPSSYEKAEEFQKRARAGFYKVLYEEGISMTQKSTPVHTFYTTNGGVPLIHRLDKQGEAALESFRKRHP